MSISDIFSGLLSPVTKFITNYQDNKAAEKTAKAKLIQAKQDGDFNLSLSDKEWEMISKQAEDSTWKDEYVTLLITSPFLLLFLAAIISSLTGDTRYIDAVNAGITAIQSLGVDMGQLTYIVVLAAVGLKAIKKL